MTQANIRALVLTAAPGTDMLDAAVLRAVRQCLAGRPVQGEQWLKPGEAWQALFAARRDEDRWSLAGKIAQELAGRPIDVNILDHDARRRKRLLVADMDSTIIEQECIDELADLLGIKPQVAAITERAMRGEIAFAPALRERVALLAGLELETIEQLLADRITASPGGRQLVATMKAHGAHAALISGGFTLFTGPVAQRLGFDSHHANSLVIEENRLTGSVAEPVLGRGAKRATLLKLADRLGLAAEETLAVGDGANDLAMLEAAGIGVAYRAKPAVAEMADARIVHGDLTGILFLQGYAASEFVG